MNTILFLLFVVTIAFASNGVTIFEDFHLNSDVHSNVLCRNCGFKVLSSKNIISKVSSASQYTIYDTVFEKQNVLIQVLNYFFFQFPVLTATEATCLGVGEWEYSELWFPEFRWKPCICPECGTYIGWLFEPNVHSVSSNSFSGLILTSLVGENFIDSLTVYPGVSKH